MRTKYEAATSPGAMLKTLRLTAGLTQAQAADAMGVGRTSITNMENGDQPITVNGLERLANSVGLEVVVTFQPATANASFSRGQSGPSAGSDS